MKLMPGQLVNGLALLSYLPILEQPTRPSKRVGRSVTDPRCVAYRRLLRDEKENVQERRKGKKACVSASTLRVGANQRVYSKPSWPRVVWPATFVGAAAVVGEYNIIIMRKVEYRRQGASGLALAASRKHFHESREQQAKEVRTS